MDTIGPKVAQTYKRRMKKYLRLAGIPEVSIEALTNGHIDIRVSQEDKSVIVVIDKKLSPKTKRLLAQIMVKATESPVIGPMESGAEFNWSVSEPLSFGNKES